MGRPRKNQNKTTFTIYIDQDLLDRLIRLAGNAGVSRNQLALNILEIGIEEGEAVRPFIQWVGAMRNLVHERIARETA
jgi:hypothetical protein